MPCKFSHNLFHNFLIVLSFIAAFVFLFPGNVQAVTRVELLASETTVQAGEIINVHVLVSDCINLYSAELHLQYDPLILMAVDDNGNIASKVVEGDIFTANKFVAGNGISQEAGTIDYAVTFLGKVDGQSGDGTLISFKFKVLQNEKTEVQWAEIILLNSELESLPVLSSSVVINPDSAGSKASEPDSSHNENEQSSTINDDIEAGSNPGEGETGLTDTGETDSISDTDTNALDLDNSGTSSTSTDISESDGNTATGNGKSSSGSIPGSGSTSHSSDQEQQLSSTGNDRGNSLVDAGFTDMQGHWAQETVNNLFKKKIIRGYADGTFKPDNYISRLEIAVLLVGSFGLDSTADGSSEYFDDLSSVPQWARPSVIAVFNNGLMQGYQQAGGSFLFAGERFISRGEYAVLAARILEKKGVDPAPFRLDFRDAGNIPEWARDAVETAVTHHIIEGYEDNSFQASRNVSRAEAAVILQRLLEAVNFK